jgi:hypothetical protein
MRSFIAEHNTAVGGEHEWLMLTRQDQRSLHKTPNLTTDNTDNTDLHGSKKVQ